MSDRKAITEGLSKLLEKRLDSEHRKWAREVRFSNPECRADFVAFKPIYYMNGGGTGGIERGTVSFYEIKSCLADYSSGHGLNFYGDENWIVCPVELSKQLSGGELSASIGIYIPVPNGSSKFKQFNDPVPYEGQVEGWSLHIQTQPYEGYRRHSLTEVLAAMIYAKF